MEDFVDILYPYVEIHQSGKRNFNCCCWDLRRSLTSQVTSVAFYIEREKSDKFCSEAPISA